ncbi:protein of unknown function (DUF4277) [Parafrankia irregularis]|uniref:DUF4277 domain-containing protein n=1 Tax=Parafrankia irregularis TaxID=795642 RepID=A0A0S4QVY9_9ACTN|nr:MULTISPECIES: DUF4277 domain-containing protein [Frankiaceae]CUU59170.1 protein of unknown function (DUF4277) [Parafrankia irregularis]
MSVAMDYVPPSVEKPLGALPVVRDYLARLDVAGTIDRLAPMRDKANRATHGEVIAALVANRLTSPTPLLHVERWARDWAVEEMFGLAPDVLNDDRLGRALDALAPVCEAVMGSVGTAAITTFDLDISRIHSVMTSISLHGAYPEAEEDYATPRYGHPKDRRPDLKQVRTGLAVTGDGGIPLVHRAYDGGAGEAAKTARALKLGRARADLDTLTRTAGSHHLYRTEAAVKARLTLLATKHRVTHYLVATTNVDPDTGRPDLTWHFDAAALDAEATTDGWYTLPHEIGPGEVRARYKGQEVVGRRYGAFKSPLAVEPMFLHSNQRIHALIHVICLALLIFCLIERQARQGAGPDGKISGLYAGRPARPTGALILGTLSKLRLVPAQGSRPAYIPRPPHLHQHLLDILGVGPTRPDYFDRQPARVMHRNPMRKRRG